jgi:hypothetical protein
MHNDNFSLGGFIARAVLVVLFVFLLMWLMPMPKMEPVYDRIFMDNVDTMKTAAKTYYTVERLPKEIGEVTVMTLEDLQNKKLILPFADRDGNACDLRASYVEIIKMSNEYIIKTNLSCPSKTDYVIEHLGCYDICSETCKVEEKKTDPKKLIEYQFSREVYKGYKLVSGTVKEYEHVQHDKEITGYNYTCDQGVREGVNCRITASSSNYTCPSGYTLSGSLCYQSGNITTYSCPSGYTLSGTTCYGTSSTPVYSCPSGYTLSGTTCYKPTSTTTYSCPSGYTLSGTTCYGTTTTTTYSCPSGYTLSGSSCTKQVIEKYTYGDWYLYSKPTSTTMLSVYTGETEKRIYIGSELVPECGTCFNLITVYKYEVYRRTKTPVYKTETITATATTQTTTSTIGATPTTSYSTTTIGATQTTSYSTTTLAATPTTRLVTTTIPASWQTIGSTYVIPAKATAIYSNYIADRTWSIEKKLAGWTATGKDRTRTIDNQKVYTAWVTKIPAGYTQTDKKTEYRWSRSSTLQGWAPTGKTRTVNSPTY